MHAHDVSVSIPSRGFWFFEEVPVHPPSQDRCLRVSIPSRGFWFFEAAFKTIVDFATKRFVSIPSRGFWFFEVGELQPNLHVHTVSVFQSPRGDFGFLKQARASAMTPSSCAVSIPSRGFWFFEAGDAALYA